MLLLIAGSLLHADPAIEAGEAGFRDDAVLVKLTAEAAALATERPRDALPRGIPELDELCRRRGLPDGHLLARDGGTRDPRLFSRIGLDRLYLLRLAEPSASAVLSLVRELEGERWAEYAEPVYTYRLTGTTPDDPLFPDQWHHENTGQTGGTPDADMDTPQAWSVGTGDPSVVIAFIDTGVDTDHPDLVDNLVPGMDFTDSVEGIEDTFPHGTQVAGNAAARGNNGIGVAGVCWNCSLMPVKIFGSGGFPSSLDEIVPAVTFAIDNGARVLNMSFGGGAWSGAFQDAVDYGLGLGVISIGGSGNGGGYSPFPPAAFPNVISVVGTFDDDTRYGSYGDHAEIAAPTSTLTTMPDGDYGVFRGTSGACPHAAGLAGLMLSIDPTLHVQELRQLLRLGAEDQVGDPAEDTPGWDQYLGYGRINAAASVGLIDGPWLAFDQPHYLCTGTLAIDLKDTTLGSSTVVSVTGDIGGDEEMVVMTPVTAGGYFRGTIPLAWAGQDGPVLPASGALDVTHGETVLASTEGLSATATIDCLQRVCLAEPPPLPATGDCDQDAALDPGETWSIEADLVNAQTLELFDIVARIESTGSHVDFPIDVQGHDSLDPIGDPEPPSLPYSIHMSPGAPSMSNVEFQLAVSGAGWIADETGCGLLGMPLRFSVLTNRDGLLPEAWTAFPPENLTGSDAGCPDEFELSWDAVAGAASYDVFRSEISCADALVQGTPYGTTVSASFVDHAPDPDSFSYYAVEGVETDTLCTTERACIHAGCFCSAPGDPSSLRLARAGDDLLLSWDDPLALGFTWNVYRDASPDPAVWGGPLYPGVVDAEPGVPGIQHTDVGGASAGSPLHYLVTADNGCAESPLF